MRVVRKTITLSAENTTCGTCSLCCKVLEIKAEPVHNYEFKPYNTWCKHCTPGNEKGGCGIYDSRPQACSDFKCLWLQSQQRDDVPNMPIELKPNRSHCIFIESDDAPGVSFIFVDPAYPSAHKQEPVRSLLITCAQRDRTIIIVIGLDRYVMTKDKATIRLTEGQLHDLVNEFSHSLHSKYEPVRPHAITIDKGEIKVAYPDHVKLPTHH